MEKQTQTTAPAEPAEDQDFVATEDATDEELRAFIESDTSLDTKPQEPAPTPEPEPKPTKPERPEEPAPVPPTVDALPAKEDLTKPQQDQYEKVQKQIKAQAEWSARQSNEIGRLRKENRELRDKLSTGLEELALSEPAEAMRRAIKIDRLDSEAQALDRKESEIQRHSQGQAIVAQFVKPEEFDPVAMAESLEADGVDPNYVQAVRQNPYVMEPSEVVQLAKRSHREKLLRQAATVIQSLIAENTKLRGKQDEVAGKLQTALKQTPHMTASAPAPAAQEEPLGDDPSVWTQEQLTKYLREHKE